MKRFHRARPLCLLALCLLLFSIQSQAQNAVAKWEKFDFASQVINNSDIQNLSLDNLKFLRGIVFGKHGRIFKEQDIQSYLDGRPWYTPDNDFKNSVLNDTERKNLDIIRGAES